MSDAIDLLETLGADADLARSTPEALDALLRLDHVAPEVRAALLAGDVNTLHVLLRAPASVCCLINPAEPEDEEDEEEDEEEEEEEEEEDADDEK